MILFKRSPAQQAGLDRLLSDQQNPSSPSYHQWLTPEQFGDRFGVSAGDASKVADWLRSEGFTVDCNDVGATGPPSPVQPDK